MSDYMKKNQQRLYDKLTFGSSYSDAKTKDRDNISHPESLEQQGTSQQNKEIEPEMLRSK